MKEITLATSIGDLGAILYGEPDKPLILAFHGWLDNAASFEVLASYLNDYAVLSIDLPGHGHSAWLGAGSSYLIWAYVPPILEAINTHSLLKDRSFYVLGHSLGTGIAMLIAAVLPEQVLGYIALDSLGPLTTPASQVASQLRQGLTATLKTSSTYSSVDQALAVRQRVDNAIPEEHLRNIVERNLILCDQGWKWRTDPRLRLPSLVRFTEDQLESILQALVAPVLAIRAEQGMVTQAYLDQRSKHIADATLKTVEGRHHFHLEASSAPQVAMHIKEFLQHD